MHPEVAELLARSNRLGADPRNTNYAGGNTSAKVSDSDPVTGRPVDLLWVKGSGGDLGTLTESGLAALRLDRLRALAEVYPAGSPQAVMPWPPRITPIASGFAARIAAMSSPSWKPGRRHGTQATRSPKHSAVSAGPSAAAANAMPASGCR